MHLLLYSFQEATTSFDYVFLLVTKYKVETIYFAWLENLVVVLPSINELQEVDLKRRVMLSLCNHLGSCCLCVIIYDHVVFTKLFSIIICIVNGLANIIIQFPQRAFLQNPVMLSKTPPRVNHFKKVIAQNAQSI